MKKLAVILLLLCCVLSSMAYNSPKKEARKANKLFSGLTNVMLFSEPVKTIKNENVIVSYWRIENGAFYYFTSEQKFYGKYKKCNFVTTNKKTVFLGVNKKEERQMRRSLLSDIKYSRKLIVN